MKEPNDFIEQNYLMPLFNHLPEDTQFLFLRAIKQAQINAYNQAIDDAAENCTTELTSTCIRVDKQSILKLKKSVSSIN